MRGIRPLLLASISALALGACDLDIGDLNHPQLDDLQNHPTRTSVDSACTGLLIGNRRNVAAENGYIMQLGILGREATNSDSADPRYVTELLNGPLNAGSPFGGNFWALPYANIKVANIILDVVGKVPAGDFTAEESSGIKGFTKTMQALDLLEVIDTHDSNGIVVDPATSFTELAPIVDKAAGFAKIVSLLDTAKTDLMAGGTAFSFPLSPGYDGFNTPATFLKFNRAIRARVAVYMKDYDAALAALGESFIDETKSLDLGVYHVFGTNSGDTVNQLVNPNIFVDGSVQKDVQKKADTKPDDRYTRKVIESKDGKTLTFAAYTSPTSRVPIIRNEELILIRAEAEIGKSDLANAAKDLNFIRTTSGGLAARADLTAGNIVDELLYNRRYSLLFEGHRWIDVRRFDRLADLPVNTDPMTGKVDVRNARYPLPLNECNARPADEPACAKGSI
jgi:hypothetical protein